MISICICVRKWYKNIHFSVRSRYFFNVLNFLLLLVPSFFRRFSLTVFKHYFFIRASLCSVRRAFSSPDQWHVFLSAHSPRNNSPTYWRAPFCKSFLHRPTTCNFSMHDSIIFSLFFFKISHLLAMIDLFCKSKTWMSCWSRWFNSQSPRSVFSARNSCMLPHRVSGASFWHLNYWSIGITL